MQRQLAQFLASTANAKNLTDLNIAAGIALEELEESRPKPLRRALVAAATIVALVTVGDVFAASPIQAGISPVKPPHVFTHLGATDWGDEARANVFGHELPWRAHDGWLTSFVSR